MSSVTPVSVLPCLMDVRIKVEFSSSQPLGEHPLTVALLGGETGNVHNFEKNKKNKPKALSNILR